MRTMSGKVKWAIGLLVVWMVLGFGQMVQNSGSASFLLVIVVLMECLPTIAVIVLTHYDHKYAAPKNGTFTLLRVWALALIWFQPVLSLLSYIAAGAFTSFILGVWVASCLFPLIAFILLFVDGKHTKQSNIHKIGFSDESNSLYISAREKKKLLSRIETILLGRHIYYFSTSDLLEILNKSYQNGTLNEDILLNAVSELQRETANTQNLIMEAVKETLSPDVFTDWRINEIFIETCRYAKSHNYTLDNVKHYLKNSTY